MAGDKSAALSLKVTLIEAKPIMFINYLWSRNASVSLYQGLSSIVTRPLRILPAHQCHDYLRCLSTASHASLPGKCPTAQGILLPLQCRKGPTYWSPVVILAVTNQSCKSSIFPSENLRPFNSEQPNTWIKSGHLLTLFKIALDWFSE